MALSELYHFVPTNSFQRKNTSNSGYLFFFQELLRCTYKSNECQRCLEKISMVPWLYWYWKFCNVYSILVMCLFPKVRVRIKRLLYSMVLLCSSISPVNMMYTIAHYEFVQINIMYVIFVYIYVLNTYIYIYDLHLPTFKNSQGWFSNRKKRVGHRTGTITFTTFLYKEEILCHFTPYPSWKPCRVERRTLSREVPWRWGRQFFEKHRKVAWQKKMVIIWKEIIEADVFV